MIYCSIRGEYDNPRTDIQCFTEYDRFKNERLNAKIAKCVPHLFMPESDWWLWVDGNLTLKDGALKKLQDLMGDAEVLVFENPYRETVGEEMEEIKRLKLDQAEIIDGLKYDKKGKLPACYLILRRNTENVRRMNERWWAEICVGSQRDQVSFPTAYPTAKYLPKTNPFNNEYFERKGHIKNRLSV